MCGITGVFDFGSRPVDRVRLRAMTGVIAHRGPDAEGCHVAGGLGLGHRRLAIIDLSTGDQPMSTPDGDRVIVFNGEIYNYLEVRDELRRLGATFRTGSDTEVILRAYEQWGVDCQSRLNGMWAFAIWDRPRRQLFLSRDRLGEKPLHYAVHGDTFVFGSEIKSILEYGVPAVARTELLHLYLTLGYIPAPHTFYKDIHKLRPGHHLLVADGQVREHRYWAPPQVAEREMLTDRATVYERFAELLGDSVRLRMRSDVPFGALLSGGLDSASVVALMSKVTELPIETFTIGFEERAFDERVLAREVARAFGTHHHEHIVRPESLADAISTTLEHFDEPFGDSSAIATGHVCRQARHDVKMVLTGDGGDEVLSGYTTYQGEKFARQYQRLPGVLQAGIPRVLSFVAAPLSGGARYRLNRAARVCAAARDAFVPRLVHKLASVPPAVIDQMLAGAGPVWRTEDWLREELEDCRFVDPFYQLMYFQLRVSLPDQMLTKVDRMSMAHSLETRVPFLDHRLVELMATVSKSVKLPGYERKHVLRRTIARTLPATLLHAPKRGFSVPLREWFKGDDALAGPLAELKDLDFDLRPDVVQRLVQENREGRRDNGNFLWILLMLRGWAEGARASARNAG
jgi:asparagine synthase (glutamine-hydrolysing)